MTRNRETIRAAIYCRVARANDLEMESQQESMLRYARNLGYDNITVYSDNGASGATVDRPAFNRLNTAMLAGKYDVVLVKDVSRISRNFITAERWLDVASTLDVVVMSPLEAGGVMNRFRRMKFSNLVIC